VRVLAQAIVRMYVAQRRHRSRASSSANPKGSNPFHSALSGFSDEDRAELEERAAILEYEGGLDRDTAERKTIATWIKKAS